jgi:hypothetical protein
MTLREWNLLLRVFSVLVVGPFGTLALAHDAQADPAGKCDGGLFGVRAQVVRIVPADAVPQKRLVSGTRENLRVDDPVCMGEAVILDPTGAVRSVELSLGGRRLVVEPGRPYIAAGGARTYIAEMLSFISGFVTGLERLDQPPVTPNPTEVRGVAARRLQPLRSLADLPPQRLMPNTVVLMAWRDGSGPYSCTASRDAGGPIVERTVRASDTTCVLTGPLGASTRLRVSDASGRELLWNVSSTSAADVPRPAWLRDVPRSPDERTAWALWLWTNPDAAWRLQGLAMLQAEAADGWLAAYALGHIVNESSLFSPPLP